MDQNRQIEKWLIKTLGKEDGARLAASQKRIFSKLDITGRTTAQRKTLAKTILPRIALYKALLSDSALHDRAYDITREYMLGVVGRQKHSGTAMMEIVPGFYRIYSKVFLNIMRTTDLQASTQKEGKNFYDITITDCLWHNACVQAGCPELCRTFCEVDDITYGGLKKLGFSRTQTLGMGGTCCDFHFYRKARIGKDEQ
ncbi:MAG: L-2-amino-thiazoline-4-carboxylic acid hydrolase [Oscillospiraceae bacterium]|nr:L-2-amino-thiazoline-4-carboxylic acid hydrolase [Oscillospiraceae bacterium]